MGRENRQTDSRGLGGAREGSVGLDVRLRGHWENVTWAHRLKETFEWYEKNGEENGEESGGRMVKRADIGVIYHVP